VGKDGALWGPLFEKAFAKISGAYEDLAGGWSDEAVELLTGGPFERYEHTDIEARALFNLVKEANEADAMVTTSTYGIPNNDSNSVYSSVGLVNAHSFTVLNAFEV